MKQWVLIFSFWIAAFQGAPIGNPAAPGLVQKGILLSSQAPLSVRSGYEGDFVSDGRMKQFDQGTGRVDCYQQDTNSGTVTCNLYDRVDLYGVFGSSATEADWRFTDSLNQIHRVELKTQEAFLWAVGGKAILYQWRHLFVGMGGRYSFSRYSPDHLTVDGTSQSVAGGDLQWREWQIQADIGCKIHIFTPYIGIKYLNAQTRINGFSVPIAADGTGSDSLKNRVPVGLYLGCGLTNGSYFFVNVEGRLIDEEAVTVSADLRF